MTPNRFCYLLQIQITILPPYLQKISIAIMPLLRDAVMYFDLYNAGRPQLPHYWSIAAIATIEDTAYKGNLREGGGGEEGSRVEETAGGCASESADGECAGREMHHMSCAT